MAFVIVGVLFIVMKVAELGPVAGWSWWLVLSPFPLAALWWWYADTSGLTKKREIDKMEQRKAERRRKNIVNLGMEDTRRPRQ
ncbi:TIGR04438 family Trp-rich protein [Calidifontimicrobium sp. SYSU G02091]|uniref:TIGR04438 family Trp-rich protein n=1 Tax=Calidifontimicrobium sp. SYSU G02091 TaxID=2926421 RepID=UPI001F531282|nr:TIGR04438 family Trp-rich protein [Calidifontimicrobium sp. SYSU G02091]MCI1193831.1 TIGR04438 family Trp-rich protein [Calidifontimicrobium sp. SYSU G02091]